MTFLEEKGKALLLKAKEGSSEAWKEIVKTYLPVIKSILREFFIPHMDYEDLIQEGLFALFKAVNSFDVEKGKEFEPFLEMCIRRQFISALRRATRQREVPLSKRVSVEEGVSFSSWEIKEELKKMLFDFNLRLSELESKVLSEYLMGKTYTEIANELGLTSKVVDNALQRVKRKFKKFLDSLYLESP